MKGTKVIQRGRGRNVYLSMQHLLRAFATDCQGVLICIYLIKTMHNSFPKQEKTHASGKLFTHFLISTLLFESLRRFFFDPACGECLCGFIRLPPLGFIYLFLEITERLDLARHYCRLHLKCGGRRFHGSVEVNEDSRVWQ